MRHKYYKNTTYKIKKTPWNYLKSFENKNSVYPSGSINLKLKKLE